MKNTCPEVCEACASGNHVFHFQSPYGELVVFLDATGKNYIISGFANITSGPKEKPTAEWLKQTLDIASCRLDSVIENETIHEDLGPKQIVDLKRIVKK